MKNCFVSTYSGEWMAPACALKEALNFEIVELNAKEYPSISSKWVLLKKEFHNALCVLLHFKKIRNTDTLICSNYVVVFLLLLRKLRLLNARMIIWYGLFIHSPSMGKILNLVLRLLRCKNKALKVVVFSKPEVEMYASWFGMPRQDFIYVPYGEWNKSADEQPVSGQGDYYFSGGYSNRDHVAVVKAFQNTDRKLVVVASKQNTDLVCYVKDHQISDNIRIEWDIPQETFLQFLYGAKAVILYMKHNTGASGQMVLIQAMKAKKLIIASYTDVIDEYVQDGISGVVFDKEKRMLKSVLDDVEHSFEKCMDCGDCAYAEYQQKFSYKAISRALITGIENCIKEGACEWCMLDTSKNGIS